MVSILCLFSLLFAAGASADSSGYASSGNSFAQPIPFVLQAARNFNQVYNSNNRIYHLAFGSEPNRWLPTVASSDFAWRYANSTYPADNAYIQLPNSGPYQKPYRNNNNDAVSLITAPYQRWFPNDNEFASTGSSQGILTTKNTFTVAANERVSVRLLFSCRAYNCENHPFPAELVRNRNDDPRLCNCYFKLDVGNTELHFAVTNNGVWAIYENRNGQNFVAKRRVGNRQSYKDIIDAAIGYNSRTKESRFYLNNQVVWAIDQLGVPPNDGVTKVDYGDSEPAEPVAQERTFTSRFGTHSCLDESDPNNPASSIRLVRLNVNAPHIANDTEFYDPTGARRNVIWGQAAKMTLYKFAIHRAIATPSQQQQPQQQQATQQYEYVNNNNNNNNNNDNNNDDGNTWAWD